MKFLIGLILITLFSLNFFPDFYSAAAFGVTIGIAIRILLGSTQTFVFREWSLLLYAVNYLLSPAITYKIESEKISYAMKISSDSYFSLAIPGFLFFCLGMFIIPTKIFKPDFNKIAKATILNRIFLIQLTLFGVLCNLASNIFSTELAFFIYLLSLVRFVGVFSLFASNPLKYRWLIIFILGIEIFNGFRNAMFHDAIMWVIFFGLFYVYVKKPNLSLRIIGSVLLIFLVLLIQAFKLDYRERVWFGDDAANLETITDVGFKKANSEILAGEDNLLATLNRGNQAWIFASTVDNLDRTKDFQGMNIVNLYLESALLPRFLAPNKIKSGNKEIFNRFSGHQINSSTSMGLGVFADGYIAYGQWGVYLFTFVLGLLFCLTFKVVERWSNISPFYMLLILPILNYAVRPDCELQTVINHIVKSLIVFGGLVYLTKFRFTLTSSSSIVN